MVPACLRAARVAAPAAAVATAAVARSVFLMNTTLSEGNHCVSQSIRSPPCASFQSLSAESQWRRNCFALGQRDRYTSRRCPMRTTMTVIVSSSMRYTTRYPRRADHDLQLSAWFTHRWGSLASGPRRNSQSLTPRISGSSPSRARRGGVSRGQFPRKACAGGSTRKDKYTRK